MDARKGRGRWGVGRLAALKEGRKEVGDTARTSEGRTHGGLFLLLLPFPCLALHCNIHLAGAAAAAVLRLRVK